MIINQLQTNHNLSQTEKLIGKYIVENQDKVLTLTLKQLAQDSHTNPSSFIRLAHKLGFNGWTSFKIQYLKEIKPLPHNIDTTDINIPFDNHTNFVEIAQIITNIKTTALNDVLAQLDYKTLKKCIDLIDSSHQIMIFAHNINLVLAQEFKYKLRRLGKRILISDLQNEQIYDALNLNTKDCAIIISYSGSGFNQIIDCLKKNNVKIIGITSNTTNLVNLKADFRLYMSTRERLYSKVDNYTTNISVSTLLDILYSTYFSLHFHQNINKLINYGKQANNRATGSDTLKEN